MHIGQILHVIANFNHLYNLQVYVQYTIIYYLKINKKYSYAMHVITNLEKVNHFDNEKYRIIILKLNEIVMSLHIKKYKFILQLKNSSPNIIIIIVYINRMNTFYFYLKKGDWNPIFEELYTYTP